VVVARAGVKYIKGIDEFKPPFSNCLNEQFIVEGLFIYCREK
jgi:hypothetical protein